MTIFNPELPVDLKGEHLINEYHSRANNGETFGYEAEYVAHCNIHDVWSTVQNLNNFSYWFFGSLPIGDNETKQFGLGYSTKYPSDATIIQFSLKDGIIFSQNNAFYILKLVDYGASATLMHLRCFGLQEFPSSHWFRKIMSLFPEKPYDQSGDISHTRTRLKRLGNLAEDVKEVGQFIDGTGTNGRALEWITWDGNDGVLKVLPGEGGKASLEIGRSCWAGKIAYVVPDQQNVSEKPERYFVENFCLNSKAQGKFIKVKKNHEDRVTYGDRIVLIEYGVSS